jgi:Abnormal spindle-like microcephaly-assoc'd, ASPM-SPD-2-Hydin
LPTTLSAGQSVSFSVTFAPTSGSSVSGNLAIRSNASDPALNVPLSGTATTASGQLAIAPTTISFGNVTVGASENQTSKLSASGAPVTVSSLGVSGSQFSVSGLTLPVTIPAGNSVSFGLTFAPQSSGTVSANVSFASNASNSPSVEVVTGSGIMPQHSVALGWNTSTSSGVVGYNIYRGTVSGGPYTRINSALDSTPYDTDSSVQAGKTYYYVVAAVESSGAESTYSNQAQAAIPTP